MSQTNKIISPDGLFKADGFTQAVASTGTKTVYISGQLPWDKNAQLVGEGDIEKQVHQVFQNIEHTLDEVGATWKDVVKLVSYTVKAEYINTIAQVKGEIVGNQSPAETTVVVSGLAFPDCLIETEAIVMM